MKIEGATSGYLWCIFAVLLCLNIPFIFCDFVFAGSGNCVNDNVPGIYFTLATWLIVEGALRCSLVGLFLLSAIIACCNLECAIKLLICTFCIMIPYSLFSLAWYIIGAVMFWGNLNKEGNCSGQVSGYMWALLILGFIGTLGNCCQSVQSRRQQE